MKNKICVVVPVYKKLTDDALRRVMHAKKIFKSRDFIVLTHDLKLADGISDLIKIVGKSDLDSIVSYNNLLMLKRFYDEFADYDYMLVCQDDVVIFNDYLDKFVGVNYIGAIFNKEKIINSLFFGCMPRLGHLVSRFGIGAKIKCGNGGLSLRRVDYFRAESKEFISKNLSRSIFLKKIIAIREDLFWSWKTKNESCKKDADVMEFGYDMPDNVFYLDCNKIIGVHGINYMSECGYNYLMEKIK